jgi:hypothetical protein
MSNERAMRRAAREAEETAAKAKRARVVVARARRRAIRRKLSPRRPDRGRVGKLYPRRTWGERAIIALAVLVLGAFIWTYFTDLATRIALLATMLIVLPAVVVLAFGRRHS